MIRKNELPLTSGKLIHSYHVSALAKGQRYMTEIFDACRSELIAAIEKHDAARRDGRADRIVWLSGHEFSPGAVMGRVDTMSLMQEAREAFVDGHYIATLVLAMGFIEHTLVEHVVDLGHQQPRTMQQLLQVCSEHSLFPTDWIERTDKLRLYRNPFAHLKQEDHEDTLFTRYRMQGVPPAVVLEADAKEALALLYKYFRATLKSWPVE
jgi:hypothetical protein